MTDRSTDRLRAHRQRYEQEKEKLQNLGFVVPGSVQARYQECGKASCHCHTHPAERHGPYYYWTRKVKGKTVGRMLTQEEFEIYREWIDNNRTLTRLVRTLQQISGRALAVVTGRKTVSVGLKNRTK